MTANNREEGHTCRPRGFDEFHILDGQSLAAHDAAHSQPFDCANRGEDQDNVPAKHSQQQDDEENEWHCIKHIDKAHHQIVDAATDKACNRAPCHANDQRNNCRHHADRERDA